MNDHIGVVTYRGDIMWWKRGKTASPSTDELQPVGTNWFCALTLEDIESLPDTEARHLLRRLRYTRDEQIRHIGSYLPDYLHRLSDETIERMSTEDLKVLLRGIWRSTRGRELEPAVPARCSMYF